jgi:thiamine biosynthesis protein ThiS
MNDIRIEINGAMRTFSSISTVAELLLILEIMDKQVAIEVNRKIIRRRDWENTQLSDMDRVEIVQFVGGG